MTGVSEFVSLCPLPAIWHRIGAQEVLTASGMLLNMPGSLPAVLAPASLPNVRIRSQGGGSRDNLTTAFMTDSLLVYFKWIWGEKAPLCIALWMTVSG